MDESSAIDELRLALRHVRKAAGRIFDGFREAWRSPQGVVGGDVRIALSERLTARLPVSRDEFDRLRRRLERLEKELAQRAA